MKLYVYSALVAAAASRGGIDKTAVFLPYTPSSAGHVLTPTDASREEAACSLIQSSVWADLGFKHWW